MLDLETAPPILVSTPELAETFEVRVSNIRYGTPDTNIYELERVDGMPLPRSSAGAHVAIHVPPGLVRHYSLIDADAVSGKYLVGVKLEPRSRGGSSYIHNRLRVGEILRIGQPVNNFPLSEHAENTMLIAGGIGITPIFSMWNRLNELGRPVRLVYACRSRRDALFLDRLSGDERVRLHFDDQSPGGLLDLDSVLGAVPPDTHIYCCGPAPMLAAFQESTRDRPAAQIHVEYFSAEAPKADAGGFVVELARQKKEVTVEPGQTILTALQAAGISVPHSCEEGICGACMTQVIDGIPDHRDAVLSPLERQANRKIMICCSGSTTDRLILDL